MSSRPTISLANPAGKADLPGKPDAATHILMYWPPSGDRLMTVLRKRLTLVGEWVIYAVPEFEQGDYCQGSRWLLEAPRWRPAAGLAAWAGRQLGYPVTLQHAGTTEYGPVYWLMPG